MAKEGQHLHDISRAIEEYVTPYGYGIVRDLVGHGIGTALHEDPQIPNYAQKRRGVRLQAGMTLAIEPMINAGTWQVRSCGMAGRSLQRMAPCQRITKTRFW